LQQTEVSQAFEQKLHRDLIQSEDKFQQAITRIRMLEEDIKEVHIALIRLAERYSLGFETEGDVKD
jgi:hypothetical protein